MASLRDSWTRGLLSRLDRWSKFLGSSVTEQEKTVERSSEFFLTLTGLAGPQQRRTTMASATCRVSLAKAIGSLPNCLTLLKLLFLSFFLRLQRFRGDIRDVQ